MLIGHRRYIFGWSAGIRKYLYTKITNSKFCRQENFLIYGIWFIYSFFKVWNIKSTCKFVRTCIRSVWEWWTLSKLLCFRRRGYVMDNLPFYTTLLVEFLIRSFQLNMTSEFGANLLYRFSKVSVMSNNNWDRPQVTFYDIPIGFCTTWTCGFHQWRYSLPYTNAQYNEISLTNGVHFKGPWPALHLFTCAMHL